MEIVSLCRMKWLSRRRPLHMAAGLRAESALGYLAPHRRTVIHNQKRSRFRPRRLQSKHLPPVLTAPHALLTLFSLPPGHSSGFTANQSLLRADRDYSFFSPPPLPPEVTGSAGVQYFCVTVSPLAVKSIKDRTGWDISARRRC